MSDNKQLNNVGLELKKQLLAASSQQISKRSKQAINVAGVGKVVSSAYEQLRNAAEYTQEHLLRQGAIRRFYTRNLQWPFEAEVDDSIGEELIVELTQAGYIVNGTQSIDVADSVRDITKRHYGNFWQIHETGVKHAIAEAWTLELMAVETERQIDDDPRISVFTHFAFNHYKQILEKANFDAKKLSDNDFDATIYVAIHRALLKSNRANVRYDMTKLYRISDDKLPDYVSFQKNIDNLYEADLTDRVTRHIYKYGAPLRVLKSLIDSNLPVADLMRDRSSFNTAFETQMNHEYHAARQKVDRGVVKSIVFLLLTKVIIGLAIEVPYDIIITGAILVLPLVINLLFPVLYMAFLRLSLKMPTSANTTTVRTYVDNLLYADDSQVNLFPTPRKKRYSSGFTAAYALMFIIVFGLVVWTLREVQFNVLQGLIFFIFFGTASFLGFRLSRIVRELELVATRPSLVSVVRDFIYMPFILLGQWLSEKYQKVNLVSLILDTTIELPLKTILRLVRQWSSFIGDKKDDI